MLDLLFVYGTLRSEFDNPHARRLREGAALIGRATTMGSIFRIGRYPGFRLEPAGEVVGELFRLKDPVTLLKALDEYEGEDFERCVAGASGGPAWIYRYVPDPPPNSRIFSGDFCSGDFCAK